MAHRDATRRQPKADLRSRSGSRGLVSTTLGVEEVCWVGDSAASREFQRQLEQVAHSEACVLLQGETGVGKDLAARVLHRESARRDQPFVAVNASSLGKDLFESEFFGHVKGSFSDAHQHHEGLAWAASGGVLFLDEIGELTPLSQSKLLRFLDHREVRPVGGCQTAEVDVRVVAATNRDLLAEVEAGQFRRDLYYRLRVLSVRIPPLRQRRGDVVALTRYFLERFCSRFGREDRGVDTPAMDLLMAYSWPGNVRELANEIKRAVVLMPKPRSLGVDLLSPRITRNARSTPFRPRRRRRSLKERSEQLERRYVLQVLEDLQWNVSAAARRLEISRVGLAKKLHRMGIERPA